MPFSVNRGPLEPISECRAGAPSPSSGDLHGRAQRDWSNTMPTRCTNVIILTRNNGQEADWTLRSGRYTIFSLPVSYTNGCCIRTANQKMLTLDFNVISAELNNSVPFVQVKIGIPFGEYCMANEARMKPANRLAMTREIRCRQDTLSDQGNVSVAIGCSNQDKCARFLHEHDQ